MIKALIRFALSRPLISGALLFALVSAIYSAGVSSGVAIEHRLEAGKREAIQSRIIQCQDETKAFREAEAVAQRQLREAQERLANSDMDRVSSYSASVERIEGALGRFIANESTSNSCRANADDVRRMREYVTELTSNSGD